MKRQSDLNGKVICTTRTHWMTLIVPAIIAFFFLVASIQGMVEEPDDRTSYFVFAIISILIFVIPFLRNRNNVIVLTEKEIYGRTGIIKTQTLTAPISKIQTVNIETKPLGKIFGYSDLTIHCITGVYMFKKQTNAAKMRNAIINMVS